MSNEEQVADKIEMLYERLNSYNKQDLFNYGYLLESNEILCKDIEEKDKEIERLLNIARKMHLWIFLHTDDEQKIYDELGLTKEDNKMLGYSGQFKIGDNNEEEK